MISLYELRQSEEFQALSPVERDEVVRRYSERYGTPEESDIDPARESKWAELTASEEYSALTPDEKYTLRERFVDRFGDVPEDSDFKRGVVTTFKQIPQLGRGLEAGLGAAGEKVFGKGGAWTNIKEAGVRGYQEASQDIQKDAKATDSLDFAWQEAKSGNPGALIDWLQYGLGYTVGQGAQILATGGAGAGIAKTVGREGIEKLASGLVKKEVARIAATEAGKSLAEKELLSMAVSNVATKIGQTTAMAGTAFGMEGGEIFGGLTAKAQEEGRDLTGGELAKAFGMSVTAGALEFVGDKLGLDVMLGKSPIFKGAKGRLGRAAIGAGAATPIEAGTEWFQTQAETYGQGGEPFTDQANKEAFNAAALGGLGGAVMGGGGGLLSSEQEKTPEKSPAQIKQETETKAQGILAAGSVDEAIDSFSRSVESATEEVNKSGILARQLEADMDRANQQASIDEAMSDFSDGAQDVQDQADIRARQYRYDQLARTVPVREGVSALAEQQELTPAQREAELLGRDREKRAIAEQVESERLAGKQAELEQAFSDLTPDALKNPIAEMEKQLATGETGIRFQKDDGTWDGVKSTNPEWLKADALAKYDRVNGTGIAKRLNKGSFAGVMRKVRAGEELSSAQDEIWEYIQHVAKSDQSPGVTAANEYGRIEQEGIELESPREVVVADLNEGDKVVVHKNGVPDVVTVKGRGEDGSVVLEDGVRFALDDFDKLEISGIKRAELDVPFKDLPNINTDLGRAAPAGKTLADPLKGQITDFDQADKINGISRAVAGDMMAAGDEEVLDHIREGVKIHGRDIMSHVIRNQAMAEIGDAIKNGTDWKAVQARIKKLQPEIDKILAGTEAADASASTRTTAATASPAVSTQGAGQVEKSAPASLPDNAADSKSDAGQPSGARKVTPAQQQKVDEAREMYRTATANPDLVGRQRADTIANLRNLTQFWQATNPDKVETGYEFGDQVAYTGVTTDEGMREFIYLEGSKAGAYGVAATKEQRDAKAKAAQDEFTAQQDGFRKLNTPPADIIPGPTKGEEKSSPFVSQGNNAGYNPFRDKAERARKIYERLSGRTSREEAMAKSFPLGVGFGRGTQASRDKAIDSSVNRASAAVKAKERMDYLEAQAAAYDRGEITAQGRRVKSQTKANAEKEIKKLVKTLPIVNQPGGHEITKAEWAKTHSDYKSISVSKDGTHRYRSMIVNGSLSPVFLTDSKIVEPPAPKNEPPTGSEQSDRTQENAGGVMTSGARFAAPEPASTAQVEPKQAETPAPESTKSPASRVDNKPAEVDNQPPVRLSITPYGKTAILVSGNPDDIRSKLAQAGIKAKGTVQKGRGLLFPARMEGEIRGAVESKSSDNIDITEKRVEKTGENKQVAAAEKVEGGENGGKESEVKLSQDKADTLASTGDVFEAGENLGLKVHYGQADLAERLGDATGLPVVPWRMPDTLVRYDRKGRVVKEGRPRSDRELAERVAGIFGKKVVWVTIGDEKKINGVVVRGGNLSGNIFIDVRSNLPAHSILGHELAHFLETEHPAIYNDLFSSVEPLIRNLDAYSLKLPGYSDKDLKNEIIGDLLGDNFNREEFWKEVAVNSGKKFAGIATKVRTWLSSIINKMASLGWFGSDRFVSDVQAAMRYLAKATAESLRSKKEAGRTGTAPKYLQDSTTGQSLPSLRTALLKSEYGARVSKLIEAGRLKLVQSADELPEWAKPLYMTAWHGSPHRFDKFSTEKIGTGEGAQAYGFGLYFASAKEVGEYYKRALGGIYVSQNGVEIPKIDIYNSQDQTWKTAVKALFEYGNKEDAISGLEARSRQSEKKGYARDSSAFLNAAEYLKENTSLEVGQKGSLYQVELAPEEDSYLLWDRPLSEQSEKVRKALAPWAEEHRASTIKGLEAREKNFPGTVKSGRIEELKRMSTDEYLSDLETTGEEFYKEDLFIPGKVENEKQASEYLHSLGVRGIKYLDGTSRAKGEGAYNYVIFSDEDVSITARYSKGNQIGGAFLAKDDLMYLVADGIAKGDESRVMLHEALHRASEQGKLQPFLDELSALEERAKRGPVADWFAKARKAAQVDKGKPHYLEELAAYSVQGYTEAPGVIRRWVDRLIAKVKVWLAQSLGMKVGKLTPAMLREIAVQGLRTGKESVQVAGDMVPVFSQMAKEYGVSIEEAKRRYVEAVESGDIETAQRIVDAFADAAGVRPMAGIVHLSQIRDAYLAGVKHRNTEARWSYHTDLLQAAYSAGRNQRYSSWEGWTPARIVAAERYGPPGFKGVSTNHATGEREAGLSTMNIVGEDETSSIANVRGREKSIVYGWLLPETGSDGEPLIWPGGSIENFDEKDIPPAKHDPVVYDKNGELVSLEDRFGRFSAQGDRINYSQTPTEEVRYTVFDFEPNSDSAYEENRKVALNRKAEAVRSVKSIGSQIAAGLDKYMGAISTRLRKINPKLEARIRKLDFDIGTGHTEDVKAVEGLLNKAKKMSHADFADWDYARKNSDSEKINELVEKYGMREEYDAYRETLDKIREEALSVGLDVDYIKDYAPRILKDSKGFLEAMGKGPDWDIISRRLKAKAKAMGIEVVDMTDEMKADMISSILVGGGNFGVSGPGNIKERKIEHIPPELNRFYMSSDAALISYLHKMRKAIEARRFFGKMPEKVSTAKKNMHAAQARIRELEKSDTPDTEKVESLQENISAYQEIINRYKLQSDYSENISQYVMELLAEGEISPADENTLVDVLQARFHERGARGLVQAYKNFSYLDTMGSPISAITQIGDMAWAVYENGFARALKGAYRSVTKQSRITKEDVGIERIAQEFSDTDTLSNAVAKVFKWVGLEKMDSFGKEALLNASLEKFEARAKSEPQKLKKEIRHIFGSETDSVIFDLQSKKISDNVKLLVYSKLLDYQPAALSEMPEQYLKAGNGRIFYMLKSYTLKQFDVFRREGYQKIRSGNPKEVAQGIKNLTYLAVVLMLANAGADELKDWILGRETSFEDRTVDNVLRLFGVSKYATWKARTEGVGMASLKLILPPVKFIDSVSRDIITAGDNKGLYSTSSIPVIGKLAYWHLGRGKRSEVELWNHRLSKERSRLENIKDKTEGDSSLIQEYRVELARLRKLNRLQGKLNKKRRIINKMENLQKKTGVDYSKRIKEIEDSRTAMIKAFVE